MPDGRRKKCRDCRRHEREVGPISWGGYCGTCGPARFIENADSLRYHRGPAFLRWRQGVAASVGAVLPDRP